MSKKSETKFKTTWKPLLKKLTVLAVLIFAFRSSFADWNYVPTGSMKPTILVGDLIFVNKLSYGLKVPFTTHHLAQWDNPKRGDIVVFYSPKDGTRFVKRVIGIPGDTIEMMNNQLVINHQPVKYTLLDDGEIIQGLSKNEQFTSRFGYELLGDTKHPVMSKPLEPAMRSFHPVKVPEGNYFMLGDNRDNSSDSRYFGFVERKLIVGRAIRVLVSWNRDNYYLPRTQRFLSSLL